MADADHPARAFVGPLTDLAEGRLEPDAWLAWWLANAAAVEAACPRGWLLRLKPVVAADAGVNRAVLQSQHGACYVLEALGVPFAWSDRYQRGWQQDFHRFQEREKARRVARASEFAPRVAALAADFPKFARLLKKRIQEVDHLDEPATEADLLALERSLGVPLPAVYRRFLACTRGVRIGSLSLGLDEPYPHPAGLCIAEYWLEADGDQVLLEFPPTQLPDPPVYYYAHAAVPPGARPLAPSLTAWLESVSKSL